jgi:hypothetical protein
VQTLSQHGSIHGSGRRKGRRKRKENGWHGHYGLPASPLSGLPTHTTTCTCGIRVLHVDDANGSWCGFTGAGNTSVGNLDVDKVGAADSLTGAVMVMVIIVIERIKRRRDVVYGCQLKWAVDKSKRNVKGMSRQLEEGKPYGGRLCTHHY